MGTAPDSAPTAPGSEPPPRKQGFAAFQKSKQMRTAPDSAPTVPDSAPTAPDSEPTAPDSEPTAPESVPTPPDSEQTAPDLATDSERNTPGSDEITTDLKRVDTKGWLAKDQERHKQQVRASLWGDDSSA